MACDRAKLSWIEFDSIQGHVREFNKIRTNRLSKYIDGTTTLLYTIIWSRLMPIWVWAVASYNWVFRQEVIGMWALCGHSISNLDI